MLKDDVLSITLEDEEDAKGFWMGLVHKQSFFSFREALGYKEELGDRAQIRKVGQLYVVYEGIN